MDDESFKPYFLYFAWNNWVMLATPARNQKSPQALESKDLGCNLNSALY